MDNPFVARNKAVYRRILRLYKASNANQLAKKLAHLKIGRSTVYDWEKGESEPNEDNLNLIGKDTGTTVYWLLGLEEQQIDIEEVKRQAVEDYITRQMHEVITGEQSRRIKSKAG